MGINFGVNCEFFGLKFREASTQKGINFGVNCEFFGFKCRGASVHTKGYKFRSELRNFWVQIKRGKVTKGHKFRSELRNLWVKI